MERTVSVVIVNYNVKEYLSNCITSILNSTTDYKIEIIVVDNNSFDGSVSMLKSQFPNVNIIANNENTGFARGVNAGVRESTGDYILILNPDTILKETTLQLLSDYLDNHPEVGICGPKILNADGTLQLSCKRSFPTPLVALPKILGLSKLFPRSKWAGRYNLTYLNEDEIHKVEAISGSCMFIRRQVFDAIGFFDDRFFMFGEDLDFCFRTIDGGFEIHYVPITQIIHYKGESVKMAPFDSMRSFYDAMNLFVEKHFSRTTSVVTKWGLKIGIFFKKASAFVTSFLSNSIPALLDVLIVIGSFFIAIQLYFGIIGPHVKSYLPVLGIYALFWLLIGTLFQLYTRFILSYNRAILSFIIAFFCIVAFTYFFKQFAYSRAVILIASVLIVIFVPGWRLLTHVLMSRGFLRNLHVGQFPLFSRRALIVGAGTEGRRIAKSIIRRLDTGINVVGFCDKTFEVIENSQDDNSDNQKISAPPFLGLLTDIGEIIQSHSIRELIFTSDRLSNEDILNIMDSTKNFRLVYRIVPQERDILLGKATVEDVSDFPFVNIEYTLYRKLNLISKRSFDLVTSGIALLLLSPLFLFLLMRYPSWKKVTFWGIDGTKFNAWITPAKSRFLRELPLFIAIFTGKMSFVGSSLIPVRNELINLMCKPGITGLDRIKRLNVDSDERTVYEHYYIQHQSLVFDLEILIRSVFAL